jgi:hypothetical protein
MPIATNSVASSRPFAVFRVLDDSTGLLGRHSLRDGLAGVPASVTSPVQSFTKLRVVPYNVYKLTLGYTSCVRI